MIKAIAAGADNVAREVFLSHSGPLPARHAQPSSLPTGLNPMPTFAVPPKPHFALRVGVTGHRPGDRLPDEDIDRITADIASIFNRLTVAARRAAEKHPDVLDGADPSLTLVSALAEGADRIAAEDALGAGWRLEAVLPFTPEAYEADFATEDSKSAFRELYDKAASVFCLAMPTEPNLRPRAYQATGHLTLDNCDLLLAVWDGGPAKGAGGSAEIVHDALTRGIPVLHVHATEALAPSYLRFGRDPTPLREDLTLLVEWLTAPPQNRSSLDRFFREAVDNGSAQDGSFLQWWRLSRRLTKFFAWFGSDHHPGYPDLTRAGAKTGAVLPPETLLSERHEAADAVSTRLGHVYRSAFMLVFLLSTAAVLASLGNVFWWHSVPAKLEAVVVELCFILMILGITRAGTNKEWHRRWLETRRLAELLRVAEAMAPTGGGAPIAPDDDGDLSSAWTEWYARASLREVSVPDATADQAYLDDLANGFVSDLLDGQIRYNQDTSRRLHRLHHGLDRIGIVLFRITLGICVVFLCAEALFFFGFVHHDGVEHFLTRWIKPAVTLCSAGLPALGAALYGIRAQGDYLASANRSEATARALRGVRDRLLAARGACDIVVLRGLFGQAAEIMQSDLSDWRQIYRLRPISLP
ncbi:hypothetical protein AB6802_12500 [Mesorhizobium sp. RCC_202]|uniref:hypothetical protein n=1 Tax=Mesorhizobium sp. RCC_202 TaxID=3239222 RepID=UPI0035259B56